MDVPFWVWLVVAGIIFRSDITIYKTRKKKEKEMKEIKQEEQIYIKRMEEEKKRRQQLSRDA